MTDVSRLTVCSDDVLRDRTAAQVEHDAIQDRMTADSERLQYLVERIAMLDTLLDTIGHYAHGTMPDRVPY